MIEDKFSEVVSYRNENKIRSKDIYREQSRRRLQKSVETKINTTMIGAISAMEETFGFLWGQGKPKHMLTDSELEMLALKEDLRTQILNNGNNQKRAAIAEINQYEVTWQRHHIDIEMI